MSSFQYSIIGALVPGIVKKAVPFIAKKLRLQQFDTATRQRVAAKTYPWYYGSLYALWLLLLFLSGIIGSLFFTLFLFRRFPDFGFARSVWIGLINAIGGWLLLGALIDALLWAVSSADFKDYVVFRQMKSGTPYPIEDQIRALKILGGMYYTVMLPVILLILFLS